MFVRNNWQGIILFPKSTSNHVVKATSVRFFNQTANKYKCILCKCVITITWFHEVTECYIMLTIFHILFTIIQSKRIEWVDRDTADDMYMKKWNIFWRLVYISPDIVGTRTIDQKSLPLKIQFTKLYSHKWSLTE